MTKLTAVPPPESPLVTLGHRFWIAQDWLGNWVWAVRGWLPWVRRIRQLDAEVAELRLCVTRLTDRIVPALDELLDASRQVYGKPPKPVLQLVSPDETP